MGRKNRVGGMLKCCGEGKAVSFCQCGEMPQRPDLINLASFLAALTSDSY